MTLVDWLLSLTEIILRQLCYNMTKVNHKCTVIG